MRKHGAQVFLERLHPSDLDAQGNSIHMNAQQHRVFNVDLAKYDRLDNVAFLDHSCDDV